MQEGVLALRVQRLPLHRRRNPAETLPCELGKIVEWLPASFLGCQFCFITWMTSSVVPAAS
jgi:hypothetical protein